ncbi:hypothetical protein WICPIJ_001774 [Wickerhamomyces pijperi]|uniref:Uncharacterized protein n=1 Tax=Wickerhamomyces pijperi TaxID=599730 RepID=A0A9P8TPJ9_WICPI|nr:hypothetical protein WICPIJ_001774 [Wickerhamomyces pijperi]
MAARGTVKRRNHGPRSDTHVPEERQVHPPTSGKKTTSSSSTSKSLNEILETLKISYSNENGLLAGDLNLPPLQTLENLLKNLTKLNDQLEMISNLNAINIKEITRIKDRGPDIKDDLESSPPAHRLSIKKDESLYTSDEDQEMIDDDTKASTADDKQSVHTGPETTTDSTDIVKEEPETQSRYPELAMEDYPQKKKHAPEFVKNPKSEFVTPQSLPAAAHALGLFTESNTLSSTGEVDLKLKYGVASYPSTDLKDKLPGAIPNIDFSKSKPPNQVQFATFQAFIENFFRSFSEEDIKFLKRSYVDSVNISNDAAYNPALNPFLTPKLGPLYTKVWNEEEQQENYTTTIKEPSVDQFKPKGSNEKLTEDILESERFTLGPLLSRLLSAMVQESDFSNPISSNSSTSNMDNENDTDDKKTTTALSLLQQQQQPVRIPSVNVDFNTLEERLKSELKYIGLLNTNPEDENGQVDYETAQGTDSTINGSVNPNAETQRTIDNEPKWTNVEDDEVSQELRSLQGNLKELNAKNNKRKRALIPVIETQLSWQEYLSILDDLDKQVDQVYLKRIKVPKHKKKKGSHQIPPSLQLQINNQQHMANQNIKSVLEKRQKWITKISPLFYKVPNEEVDDSKTQGDSEADIEPEQSAALDPLQLSDGGYMKKHPMRSIFNSIDYEANEEEDEEMDEENIVGKDKEKDDDLGL